MLNLKRRLLYACTYTKEKTLRRIIRFLLNFNFIFVSSSYVLSHVGLASEEQIAVDARNFRRVVSLHVFLQTIFGPEASAAFRTQVVLLHTVAFHVHLQLPRGEKSLAALVTHMAALAALSKVRVGVLFVVEQSRRRVIGQAALGADERLFLGVDSHVSLHGGVVAALHLADFALQLEAVLPAHVLEVAGPTDQHLVTKFTVDVLPVVGQHVFRQVHFGLERFGTLVAFERSF